MYCRCNYCHTQFAVSAAQIRAGRGQVRCGTCMTVFDALDTLSDEVDLFATPAEPEPVEPGSDDHPPAAPEAGSATGIGDFAGDAARDARADPPLGAMSGGAQPRSALEPAERPPDGNATPAGDGSPAGEATRAAVDTPASPTPAADDGDETIPAVLREDMARLASARRARRAALGFGAGCVLLVAALVLQWAWFEPADVLARYPQARPWLEQLCEHTGCVLPERRDPARVRMMARDVRVHPRYEGALRVTASLMNTAPYTQPFPRLHFTLFNVNGQVIASRVFEPVEYLPDDMDPASEMRPRVPVQVALELLAPEDAAVSFEFEFL